MELNRFYNGINTPLFSLKTAKSSGIGEFLDLIPLIDLCHEIGFSLIQLLPLNDSGHDPSPYNAKSAFALHPIYISLHSLPFVTEADLKPFQELNQLPNVDYAKVLDQKMSFFHNYFNKHFSLMKKEATYQAFIEKHSWLTSFKSDLYSLLQYFAFQQLKLVKSYANEKGIYLKGDIPILISPDSIDVTLHPDDFNLEFRAGAPPDMFTKEGQYWGFPTYQWDIIEKNNFQWWRERLLIASEFYDFFRIDHIIGFYRIWTIPQGKKATEGFFVPNTDKAAIEQGERILTTLLSFTNMRPIGEDLGLYIDHIRQSLTKLGIPGTKVPRWERNYKTDGSFIPYDQYPPCSMTTISTHDSELLAEWWTLFPEDVKEFCQCFHLKYTPKLEPDNRYQILKSSHHSASRFHINLFQEYLALEPSFVSRNPHDDRINVPAKILPTNWRHRYKPTLEEIASHEDFKNTLKRLLQ